MSLRPRAPCEDPRVRKSNGLLESSRLSAVLNAGLTRSAFSVRLCGGGGGHRYEVPQSTGNIVSFETNNLWKSESVREQIVKQPNWWSFNGLDNYNVACLCHPAILHSTSRNVAYLNIDSVVAIEWMSLKDVNPDDTIHDIMYITYVEGVGNERKRHYLMVELQWCFASSRMIINPEARLESDKTYWTGDLAREREVEVVDGSLYESETKTYGYTLGKNLLVVDFKIGEDAEGNEVVDETLYGHVSDAPPAILSHKGIKLSEWTGVAELKTESKEFDFTRFRDPQDEESERGMSWQHAFERIGNFRDGHSYLTALNLISTCPDQRIQSIVQHADAVLSYPEAESRWKRSRPD